MKPLIASGVASMLLLFVPAMPVFSQPDTRRDEKSKDSRNRDDRDDRRSREEQRQNRPQYQQGQQRGDQQARQYPQTQRSRQQARDWQQKRGWYQGGAWQQRNSWQQHRAQRWSLEHRSWAQRGGYGGYFIPQDRFRVSFGPQHFFRIRSRPVMYMGYPRFSYGNYSFLMVDPWPEYWSENWYESDDVYVDYDDGYYLYNRRHPQARLAISIVL